MSGEAFKRQTPSPPNVPEIVGSEKRENEIHRQSIRCATILVRQDRVIRGKLS